MLAPHSEGWPGEERLLQIGLASLRMWHEPAFLDGLPPEVVTARESLVVAVDRADAADLRPSADWLAAQGHPVTLTTAARDVEPLLAQGIRHGFRGRNRAGRRQPGGGRGAGARTASGSAWRGRRRCAIAGRRRATPTPW